jgi:predicted glycogen debranching enzyme
MEPLVVDANRCRDFAQSSKLEWLETDGLGGFAMGTVSGANTRRYHGHWVTSLRPGEERSVLLAKLEETVNGVELASNQYPGAVHPQGFTRLREFRLDPFPTWVFEVDGIRIEKKLFMVRGCRGVFVRYRASAPVVLQVRPFFSVRGYHSLGGRSLAACPERGGITLCDAGTTVAHVQHSRGRWSDDAIVHRNVEYLVELDRGFDFREDLASPGVLELQVDGDSFITFAREETLVHDVPTLDALERSERTRRSATPLERAADAFVIERAPGQTSVIAGYPWFTDWGRDAMIALPGLLVARGRHDEARSILETFLAHADHGILPNRFPDAGDAPEYNTADATLWLFQAAERYLAATRDLAFVRNTLLPAAVDILEQHRRGTHHGIVVDPEDLLLVAGGPEDNLTWMDARVDGRPVIARHGKPVEINALWYDALRLTQRWAEMAGDVRTALRCGRDAAQVEVSFARAFWNPARGCLFDVVREDGNDDRIRPNQLFAVSLHHPLLRKQERRAIVDVCERTLLTPFGLRTLAAGEPGYVAQYRGDGRTRDAAYHQGTVWPWLLGPFVRSYLRVHGREASTLARARSFVEPLLAYAKTAGCLGSLPEVFDADAPHLAGGTPAQAWSVAEILDVLANDLAP